jgi:hypothetical protein
VVLLIVSRIAVKASKTLRSPPWIDGYLKHDRLQTGHAICGNLISIAFRPPGLSLPAGRIAPPATDTDIAISVGLHGSDDLLQIAVPLSCGRLRHR